MPKKQYYTLKNTRTMHIKYTFEKYTDNFRYNFSDLHNFKNKGIKHTTKSASVAKNTSDN